MENSAAPEYLAQFAYLAIFAAEITPQRPTLLARVPLISTDERTASSEAHSDRVHINNTVSPIEVAAIYHNRYGNGELSASAQEQLAKEGYAGQPIRDFASLDELKVYLAAESESEYGHINDGIADAREWQQFARQQAGGE